MAAISGSVGGVELNKENFEEILDSVTRKLDKEKEEKDIQNGKLESKVFSNDLYDSDFCYTESEFLSWFDENFVSGSDKAIKVFDKKLKPDDELLKKKPALSFVCSYIETILNISGNIIESLQNDNYNYETVVKNTREAKKVVTQMRNELTSRVGRYSAMTSDRILGKLFDSEGMNVQRGITKLECLKSELLVNDSESKVKFMNNKNKLCKLQTILKQVEEVFGLGEFSCKNEYSGMPSRGR